MVMIGCSKVQASNANSNDRAVTGKWALIVGIADFPLLDLESSQITHIDNKLVLMVPARSDSLTYTVKDACDFRNFLVDKAGFEPDHVKVLLNGQATSENIKFYLGSGWLHNVVNPDDLVVLYFSSHGSGAPYVDQNGANYIITSDFDEHNPDKTGLKMQDIGSLIKESIKSDRVVVIADTCFSANVTTRGEANQLIGSGQIGVAACSANETSIDDPIRAGGLFTSYLIESLERNNGALKASFDEASAKVVRAARLRFHEQHPIVDYSHWQGSDAVLFAKHVSR
jgi:uncharacterized caspase-like protein